jgi:hypothetical protein
MPTTNHRAVLILRQQGVTQGGKPTSTADESSGASKKQSRSQVRLVLLGSFFISHLIIVVA